MLAQQQMPSIGRIKIEAGEDWYVKLPERSQLFLAKIEDCSERTVLLEIAVKNGTVAQRYKASDIEWVEKIK